VPIQGERSDLLEIPARKFGAIYGGRHCAFLYDYKFLWSSFSYLRNKKLFFFNDLFYFLY